MHLRLAVHIRDVPGGVRFYETLRYRLAFFDKQKGVWADLSHARELYAASAAGEICKVRPGEENPAVFIRRRRISKDEAEQNPTCRVFAATSERLCVNPDADNA